MKYRSRIDLWHYVIAITFSYSTFRVLYDFITWNQSDNSRQLMLLLSMCEFLIVLPNLFFTYYILEEEALYIRNGFFHTKDIPYQDIVKVRERKSLFAPCGMASQRIEVTYKSRDSIDSVLISPVSKSEFLNRLYEKVKKYRPRQGFQNYFKLEDSTNNPLDGIIHKK